MAVQSLLSLDVSLQVFLQHLSPLLSLPTFAALWLTILDFMDKYMHAGSSDLLVSPGGVRTGLDPRGLGYPVQTKTSRLSCLDRAWGQYPPCR